MPSYPIYQIIIIEDDRDKIHVIINYAEDNYHSNSAVSKGVNGVDFGQ